MKSALPYIEMAIDAAARSETYVPDTREEFLDSPITQDAICMRLQEMGENLSRIRQQFPDIYHAHQSEHWHRLIGLRNVISHGYAEIDMAVVWTIADVHLTSLILELAEIKIGVVEAGRADG